MCITLGGPCMKYPTSYACGKYALARSDMLTTHRAITHMQRTRRIHVGMGPTQTVNGGVGQGRGRCGRQRGDHSWRAPRSAGYHTAWPRTTRPPRPVDGHAPEHDRGGHHGPRHEQPRPALPPPKSAAYPGTVTPTAGVSGATRAVLSAPRMVPLKVAPLV